MRSAKQSRFQVSPPNLVTSQNQEKYRIGLNVEKSLKVKTISVNPRVYLVKSV